ncbi:MAG: hypothetical protein U0326_43975 [Polyangiales bacterium]
MKAISEALSRGGAVDAEAVFEALCKVQEGARSDEGPAAAIGRFIREVARDPQREDADDFPDFTKEPERAEDTVTESEGRPAMAADPHAVVRALVATLDSYKSLLDRYNRDFDAVFERRARGEPERDDETITRLREVQRLLVKYPVAGQAAFAALIREGRQFAKTREGREWKRRLAPSPQLAQARTIFEGVARGMVSEGASSLPSAWIDALVMALDRDLEGVLAEVEGAEARR